MGYKDGIHDGRETQFQNGFDDGYEQGFQNGFMLGKYKGTIFGSSLMDASNSKNQAIQNDLILYRPSRGQCILCTNPSIQENCVKDIVTQQNEHIKIVKATLESRYGPLI